MTQTWTSMYCLMCLLTNKMKKEKDLSKKYLSAKNPDNIQGKLIPGSQNTINFYFITDKQTYDDQNKKGRRSI